ncbi:MAG: HD domain-containing protein [Thermofilaceae archaeon]
MVRLRELGNLYWSSCPDTELIEALARRGVALVVDLTEGECSYAVPPGVERLEYPIPDFSYTAFESVLVDVALPVLERLKRGEKVLVHCRGGIGRSGVTVAMILGLRERISRNDARQRLSRHGFVGETPSQSLAFRWFFRARDVIGVDLVARLVNHLKRVKRGAFSYWSAYGVHASTVAGVALDVLEAVADRLGVSRGDLLNAYVAGLAHDVGRVLSVGGEHPSVGAEFAQRLWESERAWDREIVSRAVYHHEDETDLLADPSLRGLGFNAQLVASAVRLADTFENAYRGEGFYYGAELRGSELVLLLSPEAWALPLERLERRAEAFTRLTGLEVRAETP